MLSVLVLLMSHVAVVPVAFIVAAILFSHVPIDLSSPLPRITILMVLAMLMGSATFAGAATAILPLQSTATTARGRGCARGGTGILMYPQMPGQLVGSGEALLTAWECAGVRLLSSMCADVARLMLDWAWE
jgi:hypothetical protein